MPKFAEFFAQCWLLGRVEEAGVDQFGALFQEVVDALFDEDRVVDELSLPAAYEALTVLTRVYGAAERTKFEVVCGHAPIGVCEVDFNRLVHRATID